MIACFIGATWLLVGLALGGPATASAVVPTSGHARLTTGTAQTGRPAEALFPTTDIEPVSGSVLRRDPAELPALPPLALPAALHDQAGGLIPDVVGGLDKLHPDADDGTGTQSSDLPRQSFWAWDFHEKRFYELWAREVHVSNTLRIYVEDGAVVPGPFLVKLAVAFEDEIGPRLHEAYGFDPQPGIDDDPTVTILLLDIRDALYHNRSADTYVAGYFEPDNEKRQVNLPDDRRSNEREMVYIDIAGPTDLGGNAVLQRVAHEFSHLILWHHDSDEDNWVSEGLAELAIFISGFGHPEGHVQPYLASPQSSLTYWIGTARDYGKVYLFFLYLHDRFARDDPTWLQRFVAHPANGMDGLRAVLPVGLGPAEVYRDHVLALFLNDPNLGDGQFSFASIDLGGEYRRARPNVHPADTRGDVDFFLGAWTARVDQWTVRQRGLAITAGTSVPGSTCSGVVATTTNAHGLPPSPVVSTDCGAGAAQVGWTISAPPAGETTSAWTLIANVAERPTGGYLSAAEALPQTLAYRQFLPLSLRR